MNKCDVLDEKLKAGVRVNRYMTSYGARPNDVATFSSCTSSLIPLPPTHPPTIPHPIPPILPN